jgi:hypothetical protein
MAREGMGRKSAHLILIVWVLSLCAAPAGGGEPATPLEVYGRLPTLEDLVISPDGSRVAYVQTNG